MMIIWNSIERLGLWGNCMSNNLIISPEDIADVLSEQLGLYNDEIKKKIEKCTAKAAKELVAITKDTAPSNNKYKGELHYRKSIASRRKSTEVGVSSYVWYVKAPNYRLTHLLVKGHPTGNGGRTKGDPFLKNTCDKVFPEFEENVKKAVKNGS